MIESHLNKNTKVPTFEQVKNKPILVQWKHDAIPETLLFTDNLLNEFMQSDWYNCLDWWTILSTDDSVCEYTKDDSDCLHPGCNKKIWIVFSVEEWKVCPYCTKLIKVITEPEVTQLYGIEPTISETLLKEWTWSYKTATGFYSVRGFENKKMAILDWNSFATKMKGG